MKPHRLTFSGIGSYPGDVVVDFDDLNSMGLYLIVGPTGAGKTTLLDAITYALYGKVAQSRENAIVSSHAHRKSPFIEFEFSHGGRRYRIRREPALPGKNVNTNKQVMREIGSDGEELRTVTGVRPVNEWAREIVGLSAEEFMQVILLPQGKFQQFLMALGSEKQKLLQNIFGTGVYRRIAERLEASSRQLDDELATDREKLSNEWAVIEASLNSLRERECVEGIPDQASALTTPEFDSVVESIEQQSSALEEAEATARGRLTQSVSERDQAVIEAKRFDQAIELERQRDAHSASTTAVETARNRVADHQRAEPVLSSATTRDELVRQLAKADNLATTARTEIGRGLASITTVPDLIADLNAAVPSASPTALSTEVSRLRNRLDSAAEAFAELDKINAREAENSTEGLRLSEMITLAEKELTAAKATAQKTKDALANTRTKEKGLNAARKAVENLDSLLEKADVDEATANLQRVSLALARAQTKFDKAEKDLRQTQAQRTRELAGVLASELKTGESCPVCGSTEHPRKAKKSSAGADTEAAEKVRDRENKALIEARGEVKLAQAALDEAKKHHSKLPTAAAQKKLRKNLADLESLATTIEELEESLAEISTKIEQSTDSINDSKKRATEIATDAKNLEKDKIRLGKVVAELGSAEVVRAALEVCRSIEELLVELEKRVDASTALKGAVKEATASALESLRESGFDSEDDARGHSLDELVLRDLRTSIEAHEEQARKIETLVAAIGDRPLPDTRPDARSLEEQVEVHDRLAKEAADIAGTVRNALKQITMARETIRHIGPEIEAKTEQASRLRSVATIFEHGAGGADGLLSLEVWVQRTLFEEVCLVANEQLLSLSSNRYSLTLDPEEGAITKRRGSGLDIYVRDSHTGTARPVQTMSGGEQFMASLALALALAEVVQRQAGGIELPCLFIDEGFGGLDLDSLDLAIDVLMRIQASGRTVGIITHVETMQQQLPIGIRVHKSESGSTLEVVAR